MITRVEADALVRGQTIWFVHQVGHVPEEAMFLEIENRRMHMIAKDDEVIPIVHCIRLEFAHHPAIHTTELQLGDVFLNRNDALRESIRIMESIIKDQQDVLEKLQSELGGGLNDAM